MLTICIFRGTIPLNTRNKMFVLLNHVTLHLFLYVWEKLSLLINY